MKKSKHLNTGSVVAHPPEVVPRELSVVVQHVSRKCSFGCEGKLNVICHLGPWARDIISLYIIISNICLLLIFLYFIFIILFIYLLFYWIAMQTGTRISFGINKVLSYLILS